MCSEMESTGVVLAAAAAAAAAVVAVLAVLAVVVVWVVLDGRLQHSLQYQTSSHRVLFLVEGRRQGWWAYLSALHCTILFIWREGLQLSLFFMYVYIYIYLERAIPCNSLWLHDSYTLQLSLFLCIYIHHIYIFTLSEPFHVTVFAPRFPHAVRARGFAQAGSTACDCRACLRTAKFCGRVIVVVVVVE